MRHHHSTSDACIVREVKVWVEDKKFEKNRETKYLKMVETYWIMKEMVAQVVEKVKIDNENTL